MFRLNAPSCYHTFTLMTTGVFSRNVGNLFPKLKLVTDNLSIYLGMQQPTEKPLKYSMVMLAVYWWQVQYNYASEARK